ncbi:MAG: hypothetical protein P8Y53_12900 [Pseudolabrys sp.]
MPQWQAVETEDLSRTADSLSFLDVVRSQDAVRFVIRFHGAVIGQVYGSGDCRGRFLDEVIQRGSCASGLAPYHQTAATGQPVYTIQDMTDRQGRLVHIASVCCCRSHATAKPSTASWPRSNSSAPTAPSTITN